MHKNICERGESPFTYHLSSLLSKQNCNLTSVQDVKKAKPHVALS